MSFINIQRLLRFPIIITILGIIALGFICTGTIGHASMHGDTDMTSMNKQECCSNTTILGNFNFWNGSILVLPSDILNILILLSFGIIFVFIRLLFKYPRSHILRLYRLYERDNPEISTFNYLKLAFARGILNPKIH
jgi:hypothetical protein